MNECEDIASVWWDENVRVIFLLGQDHNRRESRSLRSDNAGIQRYSAVQRVERCMLIDCSQTGFFICCVQSVFRFLTFLCLSSSQGLSGMDLGLTMRQIVAVFLVGRHASIETFHGWVSHEWEGVKIWKQNKPFWQASDGLIIVWLKLDHKRYFTENLDG